MFGILDDLVSTTDNMLNISTNLVVGKLPTKSQMRTLISDGMDIYAIASLTGFSVEVLKEIVEG